MAGITDYALVSRATIRTATFAEQYFEVQKLGVRQQVIDPATLTPAAGYLKLRIGRGGDGTPFVGIGPFLGATAPASSTTSTRFAYTTLGAPTVSADNVTVTAVFDVVDTGVSMGHALVQAFIDAGSPVGYGWRLRWPS